jgi:uncharacterized protein YjbI with pentapeptide repeats
MIPDSEKPKRKRINVSQVIADVQAGLTDSRLMARYGLNPRELAAVLGHLRNKGELRSPPIEDNVRQQVQIFHVLHRTTKDIIHSGSGPSFRQFIEEAVISGVSFAGAQLARKDLSGISVFGSDFSGADLSGANLANSDLSCADLTEANLTNAVLERSNLTRANLHGANLAKTKLIGANLHRANLIGANLTGSVMDGADLSYAAVNRADFTAGRRSGAKLGGIKTRLTEASGEHGRIRDSLAMQSATAAIILAILQMVLITVGGSGLMLFRRSWWLVQILTWLMIFAETVLLWSTDQYRRNHAWWSMWLMPFELIVLIALVAGAFWPILKLFV